MISASLRISKAITFLTAQRLLGCFWDDFSNTLSIVALCVEKGQHIVGHVRNKVAISKFQLVAMSALGPC